MKIKILTILSMLLILTSCSTNYYLCITGSEIPLYYKKNIKGAAITFIPKGEKVIVKGNKKYRKIKYKNFIGWAYSPHFTKINKYKYNGLFVISRKRTNYNAYSGGTVHVKGYYRKDGTYVRPHTRRRPRAKSYKRKSYKRRKRY